MMARDKTFKILIAMLTAATLFTVAVFAFPRLPMAVCYVVEYLCLSDKDCYTAYGWYRKVCCEDDLAVKYWCYWERVSCYCPGRTS